MNTPIERKVPYCWDEVNIPIANLERDRIRSKLIESLPRELNGVRVSIKNYDSNDFHFILSDSSWLHIRFSGTEPLIRISAESYSLEEAKRLIESGKGML